MKSETEYDLFIQVNENDIKRAEKLITEKKWQPWDPVDAFDIDRLKKNASILFAKYEKLKENPGKPKKQRNKAIIIGTIIMVPAILSLIIWGKEWPIILGSIITFGIFLILYINYRKLAIDLVKIQIAEALGWYYDPDRNDEKWELLRKKYHEIFSIGSEGQNVEDQVWGFVKNGDSLPFFAGEFHYTVQSQRASINAGGAKATEKTKHSYHRHFFSFRLSRNLKARLFIEPYRINRKRLTENRQELSVKDVFKFNFSGEGEEDATILARSLSPEIQRKLIDFREEAGEYWILFAGNSVFFMIKGPLFKKLHTSFFHNVEIDTRDKEFLLKRLSTMSDIAKGIVAHLHQEKLSGD